MKYEMAEEELRDIRDIIEHLHYSMTTNKKVFDDYEAVRDMLSTMKLVEGRIHALSEAIRAAFLPEGATRRDE